MSRAENVPRESDILCEGCGYVLNGLPAAGRCPECGKLSAESAATLRTPPAWELGRGNRITSFFRITLACIFRPTMFFRSINVTSAGRDSRLFARIHWLIASVLFGACGWLHADLMGGLGPLQLVAPAMERKLFLLSFPVFVLATYLFLFAMNSIAARLTTFEATYRGIRLPRPVVLRALHYHAAHYLPVGLLGIATVGGFKLFLLGWPLKAWLFEIAYLYVLCGAVVLSAVYLFKTYWVAMRNLMYANRPEPAEAPARSSP
jgi:hypothetical protein